MNHAAVRPSHGAKRRSFALALVTACSLATPAKAWDVGRTHLDLSEAALLASSAHRAWMDATGMRVGLFSRLSLDPASLGPVQRWELEQSIAKTPGHALARPRGGEPLCPPDTQDKPKAQCLERRPWSQDALAWMRLGVVLATHEPHLMEGHMALPLPGRSPEAPRWYRKAQRRNHAPIASSVAAPVQPRDQGPMRALTKVHGWTLRDLSATMAASALAPRPEQRDQAMVQSMVLWGAALHLIQNQTLPAIARGEIEGLFEPLSRHRNDRGSALAQWARQSMDRKALDALAQSAQLPEILSDLRTWESVLSRQSSTPSLVRWVSHHFISSGVFPKPRQVNWDADPKQAVNELFEGTELHLRSAEREGLVLQGWPAASGYLTTASNRILASYTRDDQGYVQLSEDPAVFAENGAQLLSVAMASSVQVLNRAFALPPAGVSDPTQSEIWRSGWVAPRAVMLQEDAEGRRKVIAHWPQALPSPEALAQAQAQASTDGALPVFVVYEGNAKQLPRLLHWRLPPAKI